MASLLRNLTGVPRGGSIEVKVAGKAAEEFRARNLNDSRDICRFFRTLAPGPDGNTSKRLGDYARASELQSVRNGFVDPHSRAELDARRRIAHRHLLRRCSCSRAFLIRLQSAAEAERRSSAFMLTRAN